MGKQAPQYTDQQLYGVNGQPQLADVKQDLIFNCYLVSSMGAIAAQQPDRIRDAIRYEPDASNPSAGVFHVTLHHPIRGPVEVPVTQADVEHNIQKSGGGIADNRKGSPIWPSVMETAFAKLHDPNPQNNSLNDAYDVIGDPNRGGSLHEAMFALTGDQGHNLRYSGSPKGSSGPPGSTSLEDPPFNVPLTEKNVSRFNDASSAYAKISEALDAGKGVTLSTRNAIVNDGLMPHHAYIVTGIEQREKKDGSNETWITMRNPYANNNNNPAERRDTSNPNITVSLDAMLANKVFGEINLSPAPRVQSQTQDAPPTAALTTQSAAHAYNPNDITDEKHPGHLRFQQAIRAIENSPNIPAGTFTGERLHQAAANIAYASLAAEERPGIGGRNEALSRIDFVVFNENRTALIAVEGEMGNPTAKRAWLPGAQENATSLSVASQRTDELLQDPQKFALANPTPQQNIIQPPPEPERTGPTR
jgi:hypothetical protein